MKLLGDWELFKWFFYFKECRWIKSRAFQRALVVNAAGKCLLFVKQTDDILPFPVKGHCAANYCQCISMVYSCGIYTAPFRQRCHQYSMQNCPKEDARGPWWGWVTIGSDDHFILSVIYSGRLRVNTVEVYSLKWYSCNIVTRSWSYIKKVIYASGAETRTLIQYKDAILPV